MKAYRTVPNWFQQVLDWLDQNVNVAAWIEAIATALALIAAGAAAIHAWKLWQHERDQAFRSHASGLSAWWAKQNRGVTVQTDAGVATKQDDRDRWGIVVVNSSQAPFYNVQVQCDGKQVAPNRPFQVEVLPPGRYFVHSKSKSSGSDDSGWGHYHLIEPGSSDIFDILQSKAHRVRWLRYTDSAGNRWVWTLADGLRRDLRLESDPTK